MEQESHSIWFVRKGTVVTGPFTAGLISQYILLGRIGMDDELSNDRHQWQKVAQHEELIPVVMKADLDEPYNQERLQAAIRWADERRDPHGQPAEGELDRRIHSPIVEHSREDRDKDIKPIGKVRKYATLLLSLGVVLAIIYFAIRYTPSDEFAQADCEAWPAPNVIWNNCQLVGLLAPGADLSQAQIRNANLVEADLRGANMAASSLKYTNLSKANLTGSNLRGASLVGVTLQGANLQGANLKLADLAFADLQGANIEGTLFTDTRLANAIWVDGRVCGPESIGECVTDSQ